PDTVPVEVTGMCQLITSVNKIKEQNSVSVFPNPTSNRFFIDANTTKKINIEMHDVNGRHVFSKTVNDKSIIDVSSLNEGIYTLTIKTADRITNKKLVILR